MSPRFIEPVHRLPSVLAADIRGRQLPDSKDALRAGWAMIANDHVAVRGQWKGWRFAGWLRLSDDEWLTLFDAVRQASIPPAGSSQPVSQPQSEPVE